MGPPYETINQTDLIIGEAFTEAAGLYLRAKLQKGVTSTFANVRALYSDHEKRDSILGLVESYVDIESSRVLPDHRAAKDPASTAINGDKQKDPVQEAKSAQQLRLSSLYFLAQHFNYPPTQDLTKAMKYIEQALEQETERIEYLMTKGRIVKHMGDFVEASSIMERARELDKRDRYINTKAAKYQLRSDQNEMALRTMSMFTRNEAAGGPLGDLHDMQCLWFLMEDAESYLRQERLGLALKRYTSIATIFDVWEEDQFDFHTFSLRKGMIQSYIDLVRWEDTLRQHPFYTRTALGAVRCLLKLFDEPSLSSGSRTKASELTNGMTDLSLGDQKRAAKKARNDQRKQERVEAKEREDKRIKKPTAEEVEVRKEDPDPLGKRLLQTKTPLEDALKFLVPVLELSPTCAQAQQLGYEIYQRQKQLLPALRCLAQARLVDPSAPKTHEQTCRFLEWWASAKDTTPSRIKTIAERTLDLGKGEHSAAERNARYLRDHDASAEYIHGALNVKVTVLNQKLDKKDEQQMQDAITLQSTSREVAEEGLRLLTGWEAGEDVVDAYREVAHQRWPRATALLSKT